MRPLNCLLRSFLARSRPSTFLSSAYYTVTPKYYSTEAIIKRPVVRSVIFDFDGIIVDSETIFYQINKKACAHFGAEYTMELKHGQMGRKLTEAVDYVLKHSGLAERGVKAQEYLELYEKLVNTMVPGNCTVLPGASKLIKHLDRHRIQMAICTGSASDEFPKKTSHCHDLISKINAIVLAGDDPEVRSGKPAPDAYTVTMSRMRPPPADPSNVLVFEDSINGVLSGLAAGCQVVWVPQKEFMTPGWEKNTENFRQHSDLFAETLDSLENFRPEKYGLPAFNN